MGNFKIVNDAPSDSNEGLLHVHLYFIQRSTETTLHGPSGRTAVQLVEEAPSREQESAPTPLHNTVDITAIHWDQPIRRKNVTQILAVSLHSVINNVKKPQLRF